MSRVYTEEQLTFVTGRDGVAILDDDDKKIKRSRLQLENMLDMVKTSIDLSRDEIKQNVDAINFHLSGGVRGVRKELLEEIEAGKADTSDIGGNWRGKT